MKKLAQAIMLAAKIREDSFDNKAADLKEEEKIEGFVNYAAFYKVSLYDACDEAAKQVGFDEQDTQPVYLLLEYHWNDALEWAENYI